MEHLTASDTERFWEKVSRTGESDCWLWQAGTNGRYGQFFLNGKLCYAHRIAYYLEHGTYAEPCTLHTCDEPLCCNPAHLRAGTKWDNSRDMVTRNRSRHRSGNAKLTEADIPTIRTLYQDGQTQSAIAKRYGVSRHTILFVINGRAWKHVP